MSVTQEVPLTQLLIFDLDGTLVNSSSQVFEVLNLTLKELFYPELEYELFHQKFGLPIEKILDHFELTADQLQLLISQFRKNLATRIESGNEVFQGVESFLMRSRDLGFKVAIATSKPTTLANLVVTNSILNKYVDHIQGTDGFPAKPAPNVIFKCLEYFKTSNAVMFGDRIEDIEAANKAALPSIGLAQGAHNLESLTNAGAKRAYANFEELSQDSEMLFEMIRYILNSGNKILG